MKKIGYIVTALLLSVLLFTPANAFASCSSITNETACQNAKDEDGTACWWDSKTSSCKKESGSGSMADDPQNNYDPSGDVTCGNGLTFNKSIANVTHYMVLLFQILGPVMLIILGGIDLMKAVTSGKDDDIKKAQSVFFKRLGTAVIMFFVITIVRILIGILSTDNVMDCFKCFVNGASSC